MYERCYGIRSFKAIREAGKKVPDDYSIVGFWWSGFCRFWVDPSLYYSRILNSICGGKKLAQYYFSLLEHPEVKESCVSEEDVLVKIKADRASEYQKNWLSINQRRTYMGQAGHRLVALPGKKDSAHLKWCAKQGKWKTISIYFYCYGKRFP